MVGGVTPGKGGTEVEGFLYLTRLKKRKRRQEPTVSVIYVPPAFAADAIMEAVDAELGSVICITEGIPVLDMVKVKRYMEGKKTS